MDDTPRIVLIPIPLKSTDGGNKREGVTIKQAVLGKETDYGKGDSGTKNNLP